VLQLGSVPAGWPAARACQQCRMLTEDAWLPAEFSQGTLLWTAAGAALAGATAGILVAAYFDGIAAVIVETVSAAQQPRTRVRPLSCRDSEEKGAIQGLQWCPNGLDTP